MICDRAVDLIVGAVSNTAIIVNIGVVWIEFNRLAEICDSAIVVAYGVEGTAAVGVGNGIVGLISIALLKSAMARSPLPWTR